MIAEADPRWSAADGVEPRAPAGDGALHDLAGARLTVHPRGARAELDAELIAAHAAGDGARLVRLYTAAADSSAAAGDIDAACFFLTHAYVFALHMGDPAAEALHRRLMAEGREE